jgi:hypothetical protein
MIHHGWTMVCRHVLTDSDTNNVSLIDVLEEISFPDLSVPLDPTKLLPAFFNVVTLWGKLTDESVTGFGRMTLIGPQEQVLITQEYQIDLRIAKRFRSLTRFLGLPVQTSGQYSFQTAWRLHEGDEWHSAGSASLLVNVPAQNAAAQVAGPPR